MSYQSYEDLEVWKKAVNLSVGIYKHFRDSRDYGFKDQLGRASVSIASDIAEGMERELRKETIHFLHIAKRSCAEVRTQLLIASEIGSLDSSAYSAFRIEAESLSCMLHGLVKSLTPGT